MSERYVPGEKIRITIDAEVLGMSDADEIEYTYPTHLGAVEGLLALDSDATSVERVAPAEWPPRPGDLWRDNDGFVWFASSHPSGLVGGGTRVVLLPQHADGTRTHRPENVTTDCGPLTLVHREGEQDGGTCKCGFRAPELGPHPDCPTHAQGGGDQS